MTVVGYVGSGILGAILGAMGFHLSHKLYDKIRLFCIHERHRIDFENELREIRRTVAAAEEGRNQPAPTSPMELPQTERRYDTSLSMFYH